jgi:PIN domain nuclease of toxin-antitoxin system
MNILLDTLALLWWLADDEQLGAQARSGGGQEARSNACTAGFSPSRRSDIEAERRVP